MPAIDQRQGRGFKGLCVVIFFIAYGVAFNRVLRRIPAMDFVAKDAMWNYLCW